MSRTNLARECAQTSTPEEIQPQGTLARTSADTHADTTSSRELRLVGDRDLCEKGVARAKLNLLRAALRHIDPVAAPYKRRFTVGAAIFFETRGGVEGLDLFDEWLSRRPKYKGPKESAARWRCFDPECPRPYTVATLRMFVQEEGAAWDTVCREAADEGAA